MPISPRHTPGFKELGQRREKHGVKVQGCEPPTNSLKNEAILDGRNSSAFAVSGTWMWYCPVSTSWVLTPHEPPVLEMSDQTRATSDNGPRAVKLA